MTEPAQPKKRGRPPKSADERKGTNLTFRTRADFRARLEEAADRSGRSVTEEVELRVERSFDIDRIVRGYEDLSGVFIDNGDDARVFASALMAQIASVQRAKSDDGRRIGSECWKSSLITRAGIREIVTIMLDYYVPGPTVEEIDSLDQHKREDLAYMQALAKLFGMIATDRANEVLSMTVRQNGTST